MPDPNPNGGDADPHPFLILNIDKIQQRLLSVLCCLSEEISY
jgi:hypothetical protein